MVILRANFIDEFYKSRLLLQAGEVSGSFSDARERRKVAATAGQEAGARKQEAGAGKANDPGR
jgi:hypothetical protein